MNDSPLDQARRDVGLSSVDLWIRYFALGGDSTPFEFDAYLHHALEPPAHEHNLIVHAINERHVEMGDDHCVPYIDDPSATTGPRHDRPGRGGGDPTGCDPAPPPG